jgi:hypothetical protein
MIRAGTLRYARYQAFDFLLQKASIPAVLTLFLGGMTLYITSRQRTPVDWSSEEGTRAALQILKQGMDIFYPLAAFLGINAISSADRQHGHVRFLFSKPVVVPAFYLQTFVVFGAMLTLLGGTFALALQSFTTGIPVGGTMFAGALTWILIGGVGFLLSSLTRIDGALLVLVWLVSSILRTTAAARQARVLPDWLLPIVKGLPPVDRLDAVRTALYNQQSASSSPTLHVIGYGLLALALGAVVLRRRSLVT